MKNPDSESGILSLGDAPLTGEWTPQYTRLSYGGPPGGRLQIPARRLVAARGTTHRQASRLEIRQLVVAVQAAYKLPNEIEYAVRNSRNHGPLPCYRTPCSNDAR